MKCELCQNQTGESETRQIVAACTQCKKLPIYLELTMGRIVLAEIKKTQMRLIAVLSPDKRQLYWITPAGVGMVSLCRGQLLEDLAEAGYSQIQLPLQQSQELGQ